MCLATGFFSSGIIGSKITFFQHFTFYTILEFHFSIGVPMGGGSEFSNFFFQVVPTFFKA